MSVIEAYYLALTCKDEDLTPELKQLKVEIEEWKGIYGSQNNRV